MSPAQAQRATELADDAPSQRYFAVQIAITKTPGGLETLVRHYNEMFRQNGVETVCLYRGPATDVLRASGVEIVPVPWTLASGLGVFLAQSTALERQLRERAKGARLLFIIHSDRTLSRVRRMFPDAAIVASCHSDKFKRKTVADVVITGNEPQQTLVAKALAGTRPRVEKMGNPYAVVGQPIATDVSDTARRRYVFCARLAEVKSPRTILKAIPFLKTSPLPEFVFIGDGPQMQEMQALAAGSPAKVSFRGWKEKPWDEFRPGDTLILPSSFEALPYLLLEALDRQVPVIASNIAGNSEALGHGLYGQLFPVGDAAGLAECIDRTVANPAVSATMAKAGRKAMHDRYGAASFWAALQRAVERR